MSCERMREAASAGLDGEPIGMSAAVLAAHLERCPSCTRWLAEATAVTRGLRVRSVQVPDLTASILAACPLPRPRRRRATAVRGLLALIGVYQVVLATLGVVGDSVGMAMATHAMHEAAAWNGALGVGFLLVAGRPRWAAGSVPTVAGFVLLLLPLTVHDLLTGAVGADRVVTHLGCVLGLVVLLALSRLNRTPLPDRMGSVDVVPPVTATSIEGAA